MKNKLFKTLFVFWNILILIAVSACSSDDVYVVAKANRENAQANIDNAKAYDLHADTQIKQGRWQLDQTREQAKVNAEVASTQAKANLEQAKTDAAIEQLKITTDAQRVFVPQEKAAELERQWYAFGTVLGVGCLFALVLIGIVVDRHRIARRKLIAQTENERIQLCGQVAELSTKIQQGQIEVENYAQIAKRLLGQIAKDQRKLARLQTQIDEGQAKLCQIDNETAAARNTLNQLNAKIRQVSAQAPIAPYPGNGNSKNGSDLDVSGLPVAN